MKNYIMFVGVLAGVFILVIMQSTRPFGLCIGYHLLIIFATLAVDRLKPWNKRIRLQVYNKEEMPPPRRVEKLETEVEHG